MTRICIESIAEHVGHEVTVHGWVQNRRSIGGKLQLVLIRDGTGYIHGVIEKAAVSKEVFAAAETLTRESSLAITGKIRPDRHVSGKFEIGVTDVKPYQVISPGDPFPIGPKEQGTEFLLDHRHLWLRSIRQVAILKIRHEVVKAVRDFLDGDGFTLCDTPVLTPAAVEEASPQFEVPYFGAAAWLTQSGQFYAEAAAAALGKVYAFGPAFRAGRSNSRRHLTEFWLVEPEMAYGTLDDAMNLAERLISFVAGRVLERRTKELDRLDRNISELANIQAPFPRITYDEAVGILNKNGSPKEWSSNFSAADEAVISQQFDRPVMVHRYPSAIKAFHMEPDPKRPELALSFDILAPGEYGGIAGGGQRLDSYDLLVQRIRQRRLPREALEWYLDLRNYGALPHSGFGMGIERLVSLICGLEHVREAIPFPRTIYRLRP